MKKYYIASVCISLVMLLIFSFVFSVWDQKPASEEFKVGFVYENDETTPYTYNFALAEHALKKEYPDRVRVYSISNVRESEVEEPVRDMVRKGCAVIFTNSNGQLQALAAEYPRVQFCQVSNNDTAGENSPANYHTFNGKIHQGRYVSGIAAGMKLRQLIDSGTLTADQALIGFVGAFPTAEVISGFTAFLLGVRSVAPEAVMKVRYTYTWSNYSKEKASAKALIDEGCVVIAQHTSTFGPAVACEEAAGKQRVIHIGYNQSMIDMAPTTSLISTRTNWTPYILAAVSAVMRGVPIESVVDGDAHGNDVSAGFEKNWVEMQELNTYIAAEGTQERISRAIEAFRKGKLEVFRGNYLGVDPENPDNTYDLNLGYAENRDSSSPTFRYILKDVIEVEN